MAGLLVVFFPFLLLAFLLFMERVEAPLRRVAVETDVEEFLESARPDEVDTFVRYGLRKALDRWRNRRHLTQLLPLPGRRNGARRNGGKHAASDAPRSEQPPSSVQAGQSS